MAQDRIYQEIGYERYRIKRTFQTKVAPRMSILDALEIIEFVLAGISTIMFTKDGKRKSPIQLVFSIPAIIKFFIAIVNMVKKRNKSKLTGK